MGDLRERNHLEDLCIDGRIISEWIVKKRDGETDWIDLDQNRGKWRAFVNAVMKLRVTYNGGDFLTS